MLASALPCANRLRDTFWRLVVDDNEFRIGEKEKTSNWIWNIDGVPIYIGARATTGRDAREQRERLELLGNFLAHARPDVVFFNGDRLLWLAVPLFCTTLATLLAPTRCANTVLQTVIGTTYGVNENVFRPSRIEKCVGRRWDEAKTISRIGLRHANCERVKQIYLL